MPATQLAGFKTEGERGVGEGGGAMCSLGPMPSLCMLVTMVVVVEGRVRSG